MVLCERRFGRPEATGGAGGGGVTWQHLLESDHFPLTQTGTLGTSGVFGTQHPWTLDQFRPPVWVEQSLPLGGEGGLCSPPWGRQTFLPPKRVHSNSLALQAVLGGGVGVLGGGVGVLGGGEGVLGGVGGVVTLQHLLESDHFPFTQVGVGGFGWSGTQQLRRERIDSESALTLKEER